MPKQSTCQPCFAITLEFGRAKLCLEFRAHSVLAFVALALRIIGILAGMSA